MEVQLRTDLRYVRPLEWRRGELVPAPASQAEWIADPPARALLPEREPRQALGHRRHVAGRGVERAPVLGRLRGVFADLEATSPEIPALVRRSGVSVPHSARGRRPEVDMDRARQLYAGGPRYGGPSLEAVADELGIGARALHRRTRGAVGAPATAAPGGRRKLT